MVFSRKKKVRPGDVEKREAELKAEIAALKAQKEDKPIIEARQQKVKKAPVEPQKVVEPPQEAPQNNDLSIEDAAIVVGILQSSKEFEVYQQATVGSRVTEIIEKFQKKYGKGPELLEQKQAEPEEQGEDAEADTEEEADTPEEGDDDEFEEVGTKEDGFRE